VATSNESEWVFGGPDAEVGVLLQPKHGHTADEVAQLARERGASDVVVLSSGVVSARGARKKIDSLSSVATAQPKATKQMRRPR
jgi:nucleotide-binding universal stress UspA family protein